MQVVVRWFAVPMVFLVGGLLASALAHLAWNLGWLIIPTCDEPGLLGLLDFFGLCPDEVFIGLRETFKTIVFIVTTLAAPVYVAPSYKRRVAIICVVLGGLIVVGYGVIVFLIDQSLFNYAQVAVMIVTYVITCLTILSTNKDGATPSQSTLAG